MVPMVKRIGDIRVDNDLTQEYMANILEISRSKYSKMEVGIIDFDLLSLNRFAIFFRLNVDYLYGLTDEKITTFGSEINLKIVGKNIRSIRKKKKLSQELACDMIGFKQSSYSRYELGSGLTAYKLYRIAKAYNYSMDAFLNRLKIN